MRLLRKVVQIKATDSPNVQLALRQQSQGLPITNEEVIPGLLTWDEYQERLRTWNEMEKTIGLNAEFYEGEEVRLFPDAWLDNAEALATNSQRRGFGPRNCLGVDPAEGGDNTSWCVVNSTGVQHLRFRKTSDTADIPGETLAIKREWRVEDKDVGFDRGGGGKIHADQLRRKGCNVQTVAFGDPAEADPHRGMRTHGQKVDIKEERYAFRNLRAQMYFELALDANFAIPSEFLNKNRITGSHSLRFQLSKMPRLLDEDGCYWLPSKGNQTEEMKARKIKTLTQIIGCSPDESDALVIAYHVLKHPQRRQQAGAA